jgi:integrase
VEKNRWRKPTALTFSDFAQRFEHDYLPGRNLKRSTRIDYELTLRRHLVPFFGDGDLRAVEPATIDAYITAKAGKLAPKTITNHLRLLAVMFKVALRWNLVDRDPTAGIEGPKPEHVEMQVLTEAEIARLLAAYSELAGDADEEDHAWWLLAARIVRVALGTALRRGELLALRWQDVALLEARLTVRESFVRGEFTTPKSRTSRRTIELGPTDPRGHSGALAGVVLPWRRRARLRASKSSGRRSTRRSCHATTCDWRWRRRGSKSRSAPGTTSDTPL